MSRPSVRAPFGRAVALAASALLLSPPATSQAAVDSTVDRYLRDSQITESSGLARSTYARDVLWTHNDSGDGPRVFAVGPDGQTRATVRLDGATAQDWEDISTGRGHSLWVGDIGDNGRSRSSITVYRFVEPEQIASGTLNARRYTFRYEDGRHDAEGLMVRPTTGRVFVVTKSPDGGAIYRAPKGLSTTSVNVLRRVRSVPIKITAASFAPDGRRFVLTNYSTAYFYADMGARPRSVDAPDTRQGESVEFSRSGGQVLLGSEGEVSPVHRFGAP